MEAIIRVKDLVKTYNIYEKPMDRLKETLSIKKKNYHREFKALDGLNFDVEKGDAIGILGKNGSGKSTLLKMITGVLTPTSGDIIINGRIAAILELGAGFNPDYSGIENVYLNGTMMGYSKEDMDSKIASIVEFADIGDFINQPVKVYSSGMFARLAFAVAINVDPDILIVDEALAVGDTRFQIKCINKMKELKESGTTVLFVSHATEQVKRFCNKSIWLKDGKIELSGEASEVADLYEDFMKYGEVDGKEDSRLEKNNTDLGIEAGEKEFRFPQDKDVLCAIIDVKLNNTDLKTFDELIVEITYDIFVDNVEGLLVGVALYTPDREYIFGPNTYLEKINIPNRVGRHKVQYIIPRIPLLGGSYHVDVGIFNNESIVNLDYKQSVCEFQISNKYFSEGRVYINHEWKILK